MEIQNTKEYKICRRCHRKLLDNQSRLLGFGPICYSKYLVENKIYLFDMEVTNEFIKQN